MTADAPRVTRLQTKLSNAMRQLHHRPIRVLLLRRLRFLVVLLPRLRAWTFFATKHVEFRGGKAFKHANCLRSDPKIISCPVALLATPRRPSPSQQLLLDCQASMTAGLLIDRQCK